MQSSTLADPPIIWKGCTTEIKPPINTNGILINLETKTANQTVLNNQNVACKVTTCLNKKFEILIVPETPADNWNLFTILSRRLANNALEWYYIQTSTHKTGRTFSNAKPIIIFEINELSTSLKNISEIDIASIKCVIKPNLTSTDGKKELQPMNITPHLNEYFAANRLCDITVQVGDQQIQAHKVVLATGSTIWRAAIFENETLGTILIDDFEYGTIKALIDYMYTGNMKQATDQLMIAADKLGVTALKALCEDHLIETIDMKTIVNLLVLANRYKANALYDKVATYIEDNTAAFMNLENTKAMFMMYPEFAFKLFKQIL